MMCYVLRESKQMEWNGASFLLGAMLLADDESLSQICIDLLGFFFPLAFLTLPAVQKW
jgi:hypothetical protein